jgi:hypothetical protein
MRWCSHGRLHNACEAAAKAAARVYASLPLFEGREADFFFKAKIVKGHKAAGS